MLNITNDKDIESVTIATTSPATDEINYPLHLLPILLMHDRLVRDLILMRQWLLEKQPSTFSMLALRYMEAFSKISLTDINQIRSMHDQTTCL